MSPSAALTAALSGMLEDSHLLHPDHLPQLVERAVVTIGGDDVQLYFADLAQDVLLRFSGSGEAELDIDATMAGRAFRHIRTMSMEAGDRRRLWSPILDGAERIGVVGACFPDDDQATIGALEKICTVTAEIVIARGQYGDGLAAGRRRQPLSLASELRWAMLPPQTFATPDVTIAGVVAPAYDFAGDSFDYSANGSIVHAALFDAMGHGLEASRIANLVIGAYRHARRTGLELLQTYAAIDGVVNDQFGDATFATGVLTELDLDRGVLRVLGAGHPRPLLVRDLCFIGDLDVPPALPFGIGDPAPEVRDFQLEPRDLVLLYSDGVVEARNAEGEPFGVERLADFLVRAQSSEEPAAETMRRLGRAIHAHQGTPLEDDATLVSIQWGLPDL